jgi:uncharacterized protein
MSLQEDRAEGVITVRAVGASAIAIEGRELHTSFLLAPDRVVEGWPPRQVRDIDEAGLEAVLALDPQLVLIGTGQRQQFLDPRLQVDLMRRGIGVEVMDNAAAARTYNLLAMEGRRVVVGFLLPGG